MQHLVLLDGHHLMYRAYYAIPKTLKTSAGEQSNAVFGVASMVLTMLRAEEPDALLFCFDAGEETFRHQEHEAYKEGRAETPDDFYTQIPRIIELIEAFGFAHVSHPGFEADDLLCSYAKEAEKVGMRTTIVTGDRDALQLATAKTRIAIPHKGYQQPEYLGPSEIFTKYGIRPDQVASYKGLSGDASDNLPGVRGIGPKTASALLQKYETLQGIYEHVEEIKGSAKEKLLRDREQAFFCERMATLVCVPLDHPLDALTLHDLQTDAVVEFFRRMEFTSLLSRLEAIKRSPYGKGHFSQSEVVPVSAKKEEKKSTEQMTLF